MIFVRVIIIALILGSCSSNLPRANSKESEVIRFALAQYRPNIPNPMGGSICVKEMTLEFAESPYLGPYKNERSVERVLEANGQILESLLVSTRPIKVSKNDLPQKGYNHTIRYETSSFINSIFNCGNYVAVSTPIILNDHALVFVESQDKYNNQNNMGPNCWKKLLYIREVTEEEARNVKVPWLIVASDQQDCAVIE